MKEKDVQFELAFDPSGAAEQVLTVPGDALPSVIVIGKDGIVSKTYAYYPPATRVAREMQE